MPVHLLAAPGVALLAALALGALGHWVFGPPRRHVSSRPDYGLLVPASRVLAHDDAVRTHAMLAEHHIRLVYLNWLPGHSSTNLRAVAREVAS